MNLEHKAIKVAAKNLEFLSAVTRRNGESFGESLIKSLRICCDYVEASSGEEFKAVGFNRGYSRSYYNQVYALLRIGEAIEILNEREGDDVAVFILSKALSEVHLEKIDKNIIDSRGETMTTAIGGSWGIGAYGQYNPGLHREPHNYTLANIDFYFLLAEIQDALTMIDMLIEDDCKFAFSTIFDKLDLVFRLAEFVIDRNELERVERGIPFPAPSNPRGRAAMFQNQYGRPVNFNYGDAREDYTGLGLNGLNGFNDKNYLTIAGLNYLDRFFQATIMKTTENDQQDVGFDKIAFNTRLVLRFLVSPSIEKMKLLEDEEFGWLNKIYKPIYDLKNKMDLSYLNRFATDYINMTANARPEDEPIEVSQESTLFKINNLTEYLQVTISGRVKYVVELIEADKDLDEINKIVFEIYSELNEILSGKRNISGNNHVGTIYVDNAIAITDLRVPPEIKDIIRSSDIIASALENSEELRSTVSISLDQVQKLKLGWIFFKMINRLP